MNDTQITNIWKLLPPEARKAITKWIPENIIAQVHSTKIHDTSLLASEYDSTSNSLPDIKNASITTEWKETPRSFYCQKCQKHDYFIAILPLSVQLIGHILEEHLKEVLSGLNPESVAKKILDASNCPEEEYNRILKSLLNRTPGSTLLQKPNIYNVSTEHFLPEIQKRYELAHPGEESPDQYKCPKEEYDQILADIINETIASEFLKIPGMPEAASIDLILELVNEYHYEQKYPSSRVKRTENTVFVIVFEEGGITNGVHLTRSEEESDKIVGRWLDENGFRDNADYDENADRCTIRTFIEEFR
jgi:hypothetical protein